MTGGAQNLHHANARTFSSPCSRTFLYWTHKCCEAVEVRSPANLAGRREDVKHIHAWKLCAERNKAAQSSAKRGSVQN